MKFKNLLKQYGAATFVIAGLAVVGLTVNQVQTEQRLPTRAAGEEEARALGIWFDPNPVVVQLGVPIDVRLKLDSLNQLMTKARVVFNYDPQLIQITDISNGVVFTDIEIDSIPGKLVLISKGEFFGTGTWAKIQIQLLSNQSVTLTSDPQVSEIQYRNQPSVPVNQFDLTLKPITN